MSDQTSGPARAALLTLAIVIVAGCCAVVARAVAPGFPAGPPAAHVRKSPQTAQPALAVPPLVIEAVAVDRKGAPVTDLRAAEFDVVVDGQPRRGVAVTQLFRGPGAAGLASAQTGTVPGGTPPRAEPSRLVILVADQGSFLEGDDRRAQAIAETCLGLLGLGDRIMFLRLPELAGARTLSADRYPARQAIQQVRALRASYSAPTDKAAAAGQSPDRANDPDAHLRVTTGPPRAVTDLEDLLGGLDTPTAETLSPRAAKAHAVDMLKGLRDIFDGLRVVPGGKTILLLSAGLIVDDAVSDLRVVEAAAADAFARIYTIQVPTPSPRFAEDGRRGLQGLAEATGGTLVSLTNRPAQTLQRLAAELSFSYLIMLAPDPGDDAVPPRRVSLKSRRKDVTIRANASLRPGRMVPDVALPPPPAPSAKPMADPGKAGAEPVKAPARRDPVLDAVIERAIDYLDAYGRNVSAVVAEEVYEQELTRAVAQGRVAAVKGPNKRRLVSDFLLVKVPGSEGWLPFRDVFEVDGVEVRGRDDRLRRLFLEAPPDRAVENGNTILEESARYNIGGVERNLNLPTLALMFLQRTNIPRSTFTSRGERTVDEVRVREVEFREVSRPTIVRTPAQGDLFASGTFWIEPVSGRIVRTVLRVAGATITVTYEARGETSGMWVPVRMEEVYAYPDGRIEATATYSNFRRFQVFTEEKIKPPNVP